MKRIAGCAFAALLLAQGATAQEPDLAPLVPPKAPWLKKNQKKKKSAVKKKPSAPQATDTKPGAPYVASPPPVTPPLELPPLEPLKPAEPARPPVEAAKPPPAQPPPEAALPLPPLVPLAPAIQVSALGVIVQGDTAAGAVTDGLRNVVKIAPLTRPAPTLAPPAQPCADDACLASLGAAGNADELLAATYEKGTLRVKLVDVKAKKTIAEAEENSVAPEIAKAWAERLGCKLLVPAGCPASYGKIEPPAPVAVPAAAVAAAPPAPPPSRRSWKKPTAFAVLGVGAAVAATGLYFGAKSHSDLNSAESAFQSNGGAYRTGDLSTLNSGNSAARTANVLFGVAGGLLAASALIAFAF
ncbi:MAG: hypothetical protein ABR567_11105 [Myxococcales bacterium]|nr:hypothetical protein [Myxococcales bacterium]